MRDKKILLVEDDGDIRSSLEIFLQRRGFRVAGAENGRVALDLLQADPRSFGLVLLDLMMPVMNGQEFLAEANRLELLARNGIPVIVLTAAGLRPDEVQGFVLVRKPFKLKDLLMTIEAHYPR